MRVCLFALVLLVTTTASAQWDRGLTPEFQLNALAGGGWYDRAVYTYLEGLSIESKWQGMGFTFGATTRVGIATAQHDRVGLMLALQGDLLSVSAYERFLIGDAAGLFALRLPVFLDGRSSILVGGILGIAFSNHREVDGGGLTYGGMVGYRFDHWFMEMRYQAFVFECLDPPLLETDFLIRQVLVSVGLAL